MLLLGKGGTHPELFLLGFRSARKEMAWLVSHGENRHGARSRPPPGLGILRRDSFPFPSSQAPPTASSASGRISPAVLFTVVILALIFFVSGLLHLLVRFLIRKRPSSTAASSSPHSNARRRAADLSGGSGSLQRQLQQLFHLHDSGLDQAFIDALPLFLYREILGSKDPFDCAVCLSEFAPEDKLRLLPGCGHAFHLNCIDAWLLSNSTCPLCRGAIFLQGLTVENPMFDLDDPREEEEEEGFSAPREADGDDIAAEKRVFPVRLGKFKNLSDGDLSVDVDIDVDDDGIGIGIGIDVESVRREVGETSSSNLDARRCFSMGSYQYVVADSNLQVTLSGSARNGDDGGTGEAVSNEGMRSGVGYRDESFSVSKIWQWSERRGKFPTCAGAAAFDGGLPWLWPDLEDA
ncbi:RING-H2 finger protein [Musa troglodytarum]|uniref:RING-type E3 ubiquitin transferase n=1 Tax=Musa troglodytarum TaxID=320322 RepID=A0A9E7G9P6_9LILI|nr:RING-H2 finger protein [Musa troglodytarum]